METKEDVMAFNQQAFEEQVERREDIIDQVYYSRAVPLFVGRNMAKKLAIQVNTAYADHVQQPLDWR